jgi:RimJ/RimL family protein N-acetyltransferase
MFARTNRLFLRPPWPEDATALAAMLGHEDIVRNLGTAPWPFGLDEARARIERDAKTVPHEASCLIFLRTGAEPELVGSIGFGRWNDRVKYPELGYTVAKDHWGRGIATEAA